MPQGGFLFLLIYCVHVHTDSSNSVHIFHQNIRGLRNKADELLSSFEIDGISPHILCLSEHHMDEQDLLHLALPGYVLGSCFYRQKCLYLVLWNCAQLGSLTGCLPINTSI
jgi:hypothetical protein